MGKSQLFYLCVFLSFGLGSAYAYDFSSPRKTQDSSSAFSTGQDRSGMVLIDGGQQETPNKPYIKRLEIISETHDELIFEITYFMVDFQMDDYRISIHPNNGHWGYSDTEFYPGTNTTQIRVFFRPQTPDVHEAKSDKLYVYIGEHENCETYKGKVFDRVINFSKTWSD